MSRAAAVKFRDSPADIRHVSRTLGFAGLLVAIAIGAYLFAFQAKQQTLAASKPASAAENAAAVLDPARFQQAVTRLEAYRLQSGTYAGLRLPASSGVVLVRADSSSYCLQTKSGAKLRHQVGPGGALLPGAC